MLTLATIFDVAVSRELLSFTQFLRTRQADILADWRATVLTTGPDAHVDPVRADVARHLMDCVLTAADEESNSSYVPAVLADSRSAATVLSHSLNDVFLLRGAIVRRVQGERGRLTVSESDWLWSAIERAARVAGSIASARVLQAEARHEAIENRQRFLEEASRLLAETLNYERTLKSIALAVPAIADWCIIDVLRRDSTLARVATEHKDPARAEVASELHRHPPREDSDFGAPHVVQSGSTEYVPRISDTLLQHMEQDPERPRILRCLGLNSMICAPLRTRDRLVGTVTLLAETGREFSTQDVRMTEELAQRAAVAHRKRLSVRGCTAGAARA
jgi:GAF domain-containing protein